MKHTPENPARSPGGRNKDPGAGTNNCGQNAGARGSSKLPADHQLWRLDSTLLYPYLSRAGMRK